MSGWRISPGTAFEAGRRIERRTLLQWGAVLAGTLAVPVSPFADRFATAVTSGVRLPVLWLNGQDCTGDAEGFLRASGPGPVELILDKLSLDYAELLMTTSGEAAHAVLARTAADHAGRYVVVVEGSIPAADGGSFCCVAGRPFVDVVREAASGAAAVIAAGSCATNGGLPAADGGATGASGVAQVLAGSPVPVICLPGCPMNVANLTATLAHYLALGSWPKTDGRGRPQFAYGERVHAGCERRPFFRQHKFVQTWGDEGHQAGWCLSQVGCQGRRTPGSCSTVRFNAATSWPVGSGAPCLGCTRDTFWQELPRAFTWTPGEPAAVPGPGPGPGIGPRIGPRRHGQ